MFIQIEDLYINTDNLQVIGIFYTVSGMNKGLYGLEINGDKYTVYEKYENEMDAEKKKQILDNLRYLVSQIVEKCDEEVVILEVPDVGA